MRYAMKTGEIELQAISSVARFNQVRLEFSEKLTGISYHLTRGAHADQVETFGAHHNDIGRPTEGQHTIGRP